MPRKIKRYGWKPQLPDIRDLRISFPPKRPSMVDLRPNCPPVYDQGELGSCTANAIAFAFEYEMKKQGLLDFTPSRLFIYYNEREMEGDPSVDGGAQIRDGFKSIAKQGVCPETEWPYDISKFAEKPIPQCYQDAGANKAIKYYSMARYVEQLCGCLAAGFPFVFGISVFESFESPEVAASGMVPYPAPTEQCLGGHALACVGYDDSKQAFLVRNSWGSGWGLEGYCWIPYTYMTGQGMASDFWTIRTVS